MVVKDHKPLWYITVHLSSLISLIPTDGKLILLCDRLNPIISFCPIFTSPPSHPLHPTRNLTKDLALFIRLERGMLGFKSRRKIKRTGTAMAPDFSCLLNYIFLAENRETAENCQSWETVFSVLSHLDTSICHSAPPFFPALENVTNLLTLSSFSSSSLMYLYHPFSVPWRSLDLQQDNKSVITQKQLQRYTTFKRQAVLLRLLLLVKLVKQWTNNHLCPWTSQEEHCFWNWHSQCLNTDSSSSCPEGRRRPISWTTSRQRETL